MNNHVKSEGGWRREGEARKGGNIILRKKVESSKNDEDQFPRDWFN